MSAGGWFNQRSSLTSHQPRNKPEENDESSDEHDEDYSDTKKRRKRKSKGKITPVNKGSKVGDLLFQFLSIFYISI
jgi:hypothetical protein